MQARLHPDSSNSFQFSFDGSPSTLHFVGDFSIRGPLKLEQHDRFHRLVRNRTEQLVATLPDFGEDVGCHLVVSNLVDPCSTKSGISANGSYASFLTIRIAPLGRDFSRGNDGQQTPKSASILGLQAAISQAAAETMERTVRRIMFVVTPLGLHIESLPRELFQPRGNVPPQLFGRLAIPC